MFDAKKLLGGLLQNGMGQGSPLGSITSNMGLSNVGLGTKAAVGMGVLGVAMAAFEHFTGKDQGQAQGVMDQAAAPPPPPPGPSVNAAPPPPPPGPGKTGGKAGDAGGGEDAEAVLLIQAMIAAANADGVIDQDERNAVVDRLGRDGLDPEEVEFLEKELAAPRDLMDIVAQVKNPDMAQQVYAVSLLAVVDENSTEQSYLRMLSSGLGLGDQDVQSIRAQLGRA